MLGFHPIASAPIAALRGFVARVIPDETYYGEVRKFEHQDRFKKIERWFETEPKAQEIVAKVAEKTRQKEFDYEKAIAAYLDELIELSEAQAAAEHARLYFKAVIAQEIERQEAEAAFMTLVIALF